MKNFKNVVSVITLTMVMLVSFNVNAQNKKTGPIILDPGNSTIPDDISRQHNEMCLDIMEYSGVSGKNSFSKNQQIINEYVAKKYSAQIVKNLDSKTLSSPYLLLNECEKNISANMFGSMRSILNKTEGLKKAEIVSVLDKILTDKNTYSKLNEVESKNLKRSISLFKGSLELWSSKQMDAITTHKGFGAVNSNYKVDPDDYWKIAACDFVGSFAGLWAGPGGAVGTAVICSVNAYINQS
ncbi:hypothetical protein FG167_07470 [Lacinutrix sp. WUR7]|uniref:hypothetical protein n=1 Tax=Lacinutrix sp. WUR7 TaxID=2653681 RepID=UPI00193D2B6A|nr:hypothetical protein [Lacinutrix sp. WUR7]QRM89079.1 hypothetical protein FG167_07470 [Lacinutrix sp. WUR7]